MDLWYPTAERHPGPAWKVRGTNAINGFVGHSAEGGLPGLFYELARPDRGAAWHFSIATDGRVLQHYPLNAMLWHGGSTRAHNMIGAEHEGIRSVPLTERQRNASVALVRWLAQNCGWGTLRRGVNLFEHNEVSDLPTACPSNRIPWEYYATAVNAPLSRAVSITEAYLLVSDAFIPAYHPDKTTWKALPMEGKKRRYLIEVEER